MATLSPYIFNQFFDDNGDPLNAGEVFAYAANTLDDKDTFTTAAGTVANTNPIILSVGGRKPIYLEAGAYDFVLKDSLGNTLDTVNDVQASSTGSGSFSSSTVETIADLSALTAGFTDFVEVSGYYAKGDGGGGSFYWSSSSSAADDGGVTIQPDSTPATGRWIRSIDGLVSVLYFGALGDYIVSGSVNGSAKDNTTVLNTCFNYCKDNELNARLPKGSYLVTGFLTCAVGLIGDQKGKIEDNVVYGSATWSSGAPNNLDGSALVWDNTVLGINDVYIRNSSGAESQDVTFKNITFYSTSSGGVGAGRLLEISSAQSGGVYDFGSLPPFDDCHIVNFGSAIVVAACNGLTFNNVVFRGCKQPFIIGNSVPSTGENVRVVNCMFENCGDASTDFIELDNISGFVFDRCSFAETSAISLRVALAQALSFVNCLMGDASLNSLDLFLHIPTGTGINVDNVVFDNCISAHLFSGTTTADINLVQGSNLATLTLKDCDLSSTINIGTDKVICTKIGTVNNYAFSNVGVGQINSFTSEEFEYGDVAIDAGVISRTSLTESVIVAGGDTSSTARGGIISLHGINDVTNGAVEIQAGDTTGEITLTTSATRQVTVTNSDDTTNTTTGALAVSGGMSVFKGISANNYNIGNTDDTTTASGTVAAGSSYAGIVHQTAASGAIVVSTTASSTTALIFLTKTNSSGTDSLNVTTRSSSAFTIQNMVSGESCSWLIINPV